MTREELRVALDALSDDEFEQLVREFGGGHSGRKSVVRAFVDNPNLERRLCQLLGLPTEAEKSVQAAVDAAAAAKRSAVCSAVSAVIALASLAVMVLTFVLSKPS